MFELIPFTHTHNVDTYHPFRDLDELERSFFSGSNSLGGFRTDIKDTGDAIVLEADLPGVKKEDIHIDIDGNYLAITAQRSTSREDKDSAGNYLRCERSYGSFSRSFDISGIKSAEIKGSYENGVLKLVLPKEAPTAPTSRRLNLE